MLLGNRRARADQSWATASLSLLAPGTVLGLAALFSFWASALGWAGEVRVVETSGSDSVLIETRDASADEVLTVLAVHFDFAVERNVGSGQAIRFSGRLQGSLDQLLERLLRHEGHIIVRSAGARAGVARVVRLKDGEAPPPSFADKLAKLSAGFPLQARLQAPEMWAGVD
jgi:hypothetical protein